MRYVERDLNGKIKGDYANPQPGYAEEAVNESSPEYQAYVAAQATQAANNEIKAQLAAADLKIIRALTEGDTVRIAAHVLAQAALRAKLLP